MIGHGCVMTLAPVPTFGLMATRLNDIETVHAWFLDSTIMAAPAMPTITPELAGQMVDKAPRTITNYDKLLAVSRVSSHTA